MSLFGRWTKPEMAIVVGVLVIIFTILQTARTAIVRSQRLDMVRTDLTSIVDASRLFFDEYGTWPTAYMGEIGDFRYGREFGNNLVINPLRAREGPGNRKHLLNPNRIVFLNVAPYYLGLSGVNEEGEFLDPWGNPYHIVLDTDLNTSCNIPHSIYGRRENTGIAVWSSGPDGVSDTHDDLKSWDL